MASGVVKPFTYVTLPFVALIMFYFIYEQKYLFQQLDDEYVHLRVSAILQISSLVAKRIKLFLLTRQETLHFSLFKLVVNREVSYSFSKKAF